MEAQKIRDAIDELKNEALAAVADVGAEADLAGLRHRFLGRKGRLTVILRALGQLSSEERPVVGKEANAVRVTLEEAFARREADLSEGILEERLQTEAVDVTLPGRQPRVGRKHILTQMLEEITTVFLGLGFRVAEGPEVELDYYNFEALNIPQDHPARSLQDTLYIASDGEDVLLRTHTSPVQIRVMEKKEPPLYIIAPGKVYRRDVADPTHSPMFHQVEGLAVDSEISFGDLKGTLQCFVESIFGKERRVRFRPHYFAFTEPSAEVDVSCGHCDARGCRSCGGKGWLEILGAGMVDPNVLEEVGYDSEKYVGFAFGMGVERIAMLKYGLKDLRLFFENDLRFLEQF